MSDDQTKSTRSGARLSRRALIFGSSAFILGIGIISGTLAAQPVLEALVDTIIPADEFGPAASETGAVEAIWSSMEGRLTDRLRLRMMFAWLNLSAGGSFARTGLSERSALLAAMAAKPFDDPRRRFYEWIRERTMQHYYGSAARAEALGFVGAPQPMGYPDAAAPWTEHA